MWLLIYRVIEPESRIVYRRVFPELDANASFAHVSTRRDFDAFAECLGRLLDGTEDADGDVTYHDALGDVYMRLELGNFRGGQYFTPWDVCVLMARMTVGDVAGEIARRRAAENYAPVTVSDPACGSGRMFLAVASLCPREAIERSWVLFYGQDIDAMCATMARCNVRLYGLNGSALPVLMQRSIT